MTSTSTSPWPQVTVPFADHVGIDYLERSEQRGVARLPESTHLTNHIGSQHAAALFTVAESASGAAAIGRFGDIFATTLPLVKEASIQYKKVAQGPITATAVIRETRESVLDQLDREGKAQLQVDVTLTNQQADIVALVNVQWHLRSMPASR